MSKEVLSSAIEIKIGKLIDGPAVKDAVHVAIYPATAGEQLLPGQRVKVKNGFATLSIYDSVGIVDPFLRAVIEVGQKFWVCILPGTVTSLTHNWTHPAFDQELPVGKEAYDR